ncbi:hypothetical protein M153_11430001158 [Pseudoloma neurophilia]|uniref:Uncharacterized protein n=1 Tax=Pseudoloma neurophilia TaxID=146866 RepID=A0A0R0M4G8_9MICR|nr:hypothetical protein M153_11430001158 [Pseudoloma neurophilia]
MKRLVLKGADIQLIDVKALKFFISEYNFDGKELEDKNMTKEKEHEKTENILKISQLNVSLQYKTSYFILIDINQDLIYKLYDILDGRIFEENIVIECFLIDEKVDVGQTVKNKDKFDQMLQTGELKEQEESSDEKSEEKNKIVTNKQLKKRERKKMRKQQRAEEIKERIAKRDDGFVFNPDDERFSLVKTDKRFKIEKHN